MALSYTRLLCRRTIDLRHLRSVYTCSPLSAAVTKPALGAAPICESHDERNMRLKRPMSPHMTIYQFQLTAVLSITHRTTGIILTSYAVALGLGTLLIPGGVPCMIETVAAMNLPAAVLLASKAMLAFPATYHTFNGLRHLAWDMGLFLTIKQVYSTGYLVTAISALSAAALAIMY